MKREITRRDVLKTSAMGAAILGTGHLTARPAHAIEYTKPVPEAEGLTAYQNGANILLRLDNAPLLGYRAHPTLKYPYFYPLNGPVSGLPLTSESALPYPHHRSLWLGCDPVNGGNYWADNELSSGHIRSLELALDTAAATKTSVTFTQRCVWERPGAAAPFRDERRFTVSVPRPDVHLIDCTFRLVAQEDISIARAKHSFFAMRAAPDISMAYGGVLMNAEGGVGAGGTYGKPSKWCGFHGKRRFRPDVVEGIAIMDHPGNFGGKCPWFTREYGHLSPSPFNFNEDAWRMAAGETLELNYRVVLHAGTPAEAGLDQLYASWIAG